MFELPSLHLAFFTGRLLSLFSFFTGFSLDLSLVAHLSSSLMYVFGPSPFSPLDALSSPLPPNHHPPSVMSAESPILISPTLLSPVQAPLSLPSPTDSLGKTQTAIQVDENQQPEQDVIEVKQEEEEIDQIHEEEDDVEHREQEMVVEYEEQKHQEEREVEQGEARRDEEEEVAINDEPLSPSSSLPALWSPKRKHTENDGEQHAVEADEEPVEKRQRVVDAEEVEAEPRRQEEEQLAVVVQQSSSPPAPEHHVVEEKRKMLWSGDLRDQVSPDEE